MTRNTHEAPSGKPIAAKLLAKMERTLRSKVVNIQGAIDGRARAEELQKTVVSPEALASMELAHAAYVYTQNQVSVLWQQLAPLKEMVRFARMIAKAQDLYMPSEPPISPLTTSYFTCWAFFDACAGRANETIGTTILEFGAVARIQNETLRLIRLMQESRMGLYVHKGREGKLIVLEELATEALCRAIVPAGYHGVKGELWYARVLPPPILGSSEHVVFTTPYILVQPGPREWLTYFKRALPEPARVCDYAHHMKYGPTREYWNDFVFEAYVNHQADAIYLAGLPDVPESRPHSDVSEANGWKPPAFIKQS